MKKRDYIVKFWPQPRNAKVKSSPAEITIPDCTCEADARHKFHSAWPGLDIIRVRADRNTVSQHDVAKYRYSKRY